MLMILMHYSTLSNSQDIEKLDSWNGVSIDTKNHYISVRDSFKLYMYSDKKKGRIFSDSLIVLARNIGPVKELESISNKGSYYFIIDELDSAKHYFFRVIESDLAKGNPKYAHFAKLTLSQGYMKGGNYDLAEKLLKEIESSDYDIDDKLFSVYLYRSILGSYEKNKEKEIKNLIKADSIGTIDLKHRFNLYYNLGGTMFNSHDYQKAVQYYEKAIPLIDSISAFSYYPVLYNVMAAGYEKIDSLSKMKLYIEKALEKAYLSPKEKGVAYHYLSTYYLRLKDFQSAQEANNQALEEFRLHDYRFYLLLGLNSAIFIKNKLRDESSSEHLIDEAYEKCSAFFSLQDSLIFEEYRIRDKFRIELNSHDYQQLVSFLDAKTVFEENRTNDKVAELIKKYDLEKKESKIRLLEEKDKLAFAKIQRRNIIVGGLSALSLALVSLFFINQRALRKEKWISKFLLEKQEQLVYENQELVAQVNKNGLNRQGEVKDQTLILTNKENTKLSLQDIIYLESRDKSVYIYTVDGQEFREWQTLKSFVNLLPNDFIQIHRSFIVNLSHIQERRGQTLTMTNNIVLNISRSFFKKTVERLSE